MVFLLGPRMMLYLAIGFTLANTFKEKSDDESFMSATESATTLQEEEPTVETSEPAVETSEPAVETSEPAGANDATTMLPTLPVRVKNSPPTDEPKSQSGRESSKVAGSTDLLSQATTASSLAPGNTTSSTTSVLTTPPSDRGSCILVNWMVILGAVFCSFYC